VLKDSHTINLLSENKTVKAKNILIATGGKANLDSQLPGIEHVITSNEAFHLEHLPRSIIIAGGGYIAVEFAGIFSGLGVETTILYRGEEILRGFDDDLRQGLHEAYEKRGIRVICGQVFERIEKTSTGLDGQLTDGTVLSADQIMFAIGRSPNTSGLGLENAGVETNDKGAVVVNDYSKTNIDHIFAVGDVTNRVNLTPVAIHEGHAFADTQFGGRVRPVDHTHIPTAVFSQPEIGTIGLTEGEARSAYTAIDVYKSRFRPMKYTISGRDEFMLMKLIIDQASGRVLGCHILGPDGAEIVQMAAVAIRMGATKSDFDATMALHPSAGEELVTMRQKWQPAEAA
jgi:glutathione reductase (NADPH)